MLQEQELKTSSTARRTTSSRGAAGRLHRLALSRHQGRSGASMTTGRDHDYRQARVGWCISTAPRAMLTVLSDEDAGDGFQP